MKTQKILKYKPIFSSTLVVSIEANSIPFHPFVSFTNPQHFPPFGVFVRQERWNMDFPFSWPSSLHSYFPFFWPSFSAFIFVSGAGMWWESICGYVFQGGCAVHGMCSVAGLFSAFYVYEFGLFFGHLMCPVMFYRHCCWILSSKKYFPSWKRLDLDTFYLHTFIQPILISI